MMGSRNENRGEYPRNWRRISYRVKRLHGFRCERCGHPHVPTPSREFEDLWTRDWKLWRIDDTVGFTALKPELPSTCDCDHKCRKHPYDPDKPRVLTVHHLDGDKSNCALWNLAALCQVCHLVIQAKLCWDQAYLGEHSDWLKWHLNRYKRWCERHNLPVFHQVT